MWTIRRSHQHVKLETLSEYLDGRIHGSDLARVEQQLGSCGVCRDEVESLRSTVQLLRGLPQEVSVGSFVMAAPPHQPVRASKASDH